MAIDTSKMKAYGIKGTWQKVRSANGPAQHLACATTGLIMAGMFVHMVHPVIIGLWATMSVAVVFSTIWMPRTVLMYTLLVDFVLSLVVCFQYLMYEPEKPVIPIYHVNTAEGMKAAIRPTMEMQMGLIDTASHVAAVIWLSLWSLYLANLVHRQILELRFSNDH